VRLPSPLRARWATRLRRLARLRWKAAASQPPQGLRQLRLRCCKRRICGCGHMQTPNLDALASASLSGGVSKVWSVVSTLPVDWRNVSGGGNFSTMPEAFKQSGYLTLGIGKIFHGSTETCLECSWSPESLPYDQGGNHCPYGGPATNDEWLPTPSSNSTLVEGSVRRVVVAQAIQRLFFQRLFFSCPLALLVLAC
jgi:hypothetical protein